MRVTLFLFVLWAVLGPAPAAADEFQDALNDGNIHYDRKEWEKAKACFERALRADPQSAEAQALVGSAVGQLGRNEESIELLKKALTLKHTNDDTRAYICKEIGLNYGHLGKDKEALAAFQEALKIDPDNVSALRNVGTAYAKLEMWAEAIEAWRKALRLDPRQNDLLARIADAERRKAQAPAEEGPGATEAPADGTVSFTLPPVGGWIVDADGSTLILSLPERTELAWFSTVENKELRRTTLDFKPGWLARQGTTLFVTASGASLMYALDIKSGKVQKEIKVPGEPLVQIACHPTKGPLYASNSREEVISIDPKSGTVTNTPARGCFLAVDPDSDAFVYTGRTSPKDWDVEVEKDEKGNETWYFDDWGYRSMIRKYAVQGESLKEVAVNGNTAVNGRAMHLSPDGRRIMIVGGGGWRPKRGGSGGGYVIAVYGTDDINSMIGQIALDAYPENVAFHPDLNIGVALRSDARLILFNGKSLASIREWQVKDAPRGFDESGWLTFGGKGTKLIYWQMGGSNKQETGKLYFIPLELTSEERTSLAKKHGSAGGSSAPSSAPPASSDPEALFKQAEAAEKAGDLEKAIALYRQVVDANADSELGNKASQKVLDLEARKDPASKAKSLLNTARNLEKNGQSARAVEYYRRIMKEFPGTPEADEARKRINELGRK